MTEKVKKNLDHTEEVSKEFAATIREWLTDDELIEVIRRNSKEDINGTGCSFCHTHDFCDPNQLMFEIIDGHLAKDYEQKVIEQGGLPDDQAEYTALFEAWNKETNQKIQSPETTPLMTLWNEAWTLAKLNKFYRGCEQYGQKNRTGINGNDQKIS